MSVGLWLTAGAVGAAALARSAARNGGNVLTTRWGGTGYRPTANVEGARWARRGDLALLTVARPRPGRLVLGTAGRRLVAAERGHSVLVVGPTQSHKTTGLAVPAILEWEGPVLAVSVKADLARHTISWRRRAGDVWVFDPSRSTGLRAAQWSPVDAARTWTGARRVAHRLVEAARPASGSLSDGDFWFATAAKLLAPLLLAAAVDGLGMADVVRWLDEQQDMEVADLLFAAGEHQALQALRATRQRDDRQRSAVYTTAEMVVEGFTDLVPMAASADVIEPARLVEGHHTLYLCAPAHEQRRLRALFSALCAEVLDHAFAAAAAGGPLDPPLLVVIDEAANVAPLPELDTVASTAAGHGVQLVTVWQDLSQITARYGARAGSVVNNHRAKLFLSGIADPPTLEHASALIGDAEDHQKSVTFDGRGGRSTTQAPATRRLAPADLLRRIPPGNAVLVTGHLPPVRLRLRPWWRHGELRRRATFASATTDFAAG